MNRMQPKGFARARCLALTAAVVGLGLAGCSGSGSTVSGAVSSESSSGAVSSGTVSTGTGTGTGTGSDPAASGAAAATGSAAPAASSSAVAGQGGSPVAIRTSGQADCRRLPVVRAKSLLGESVSAHADRRSTDPSRRQLDGCVYTTSGQARLSYVVWQLSRKARAADLPAAAPAGSGVGTFDPGLSGAVADHGVALSMSGLYAAQVGAAKGRLVVEVVAQGGSAATARRAAVGAAKELLG